MEKILNPHFISHIRILDIYFLVCKVTAPEYFPSSSSIPSFFTMHANCSLCYTESLTNELICSFGCKLDANLVRVATRNGIVPAINSLANDGIVRVIRQEHEQLEALVEEYFDTSDMTDDEVGSDAKMECMQ